MLPLMMLLPLAAAAPTYPQVLVEITIAASDDAGMRARLDAAARCQPDALGGASAAAVVVSALRGGSLTVLASPRVTTLDGQAAEVVIGGGGGRTEVRVTPTLEEGGIRLDTAAVVADGARSSSGAAELLLASGSHAVWPMDDLIVIVGAYVAEDDDAVAAIEAERARRGAVVAGLPRSRLQAIDAALAPCR